MGWMSWLMTLGKLINSMDIIVSELTQLKVLQYSSHSCDIVWVLWCIRVRLIFLKYCREDLSFHNLSDQRGKHILVQQIFPAHRTIYFSQLLETFIAWNCCFSDSTGIYLFKFKNTNSIIKCKTCSKLAIETIDIVLVSLLFALNIFDTLF